MIFLQIDEPFDQEVHADWLEGAALAALDHQKTSTASELTIVVSDDAHLQDLNRQYLDIDAPTDVLSFPAEETDLESGNPYLGDIILSFPRAQEQARSGGHPVEDEIRLLVVHGVLHLLGYDHGEEEEQKVMWAAQAEILEQLGSSIRGPRSIG